MKKRTYIFLGIGLLAATLTTTCEKDNTNYELMYPSALVTVKPSADNSSFVLQLDDKTVLKPVNMDKSPYGTKEVRALVNFRETAPNEVHINWLDSILTRNTDKTPLRL